MDLRDMVGANVVGLKLGDLPAQLGHFTGRIVCRVAMFAMRLLRDYG